MIYKKTRHGTLEYFNSVFRFEKKILKDFLESRMFVVLLSLKSLKYLSSIFHSY